MELWLKKNSWVWRERMSSLSSWGKNNSSSQRFSQFSYKTKSQTHVSAAESSHWSDGAATRWNCQLILQVASSPSHTAACQRSPTLSIRSLRCWNVFPLALATRAVARSVLVPRGLAQHQKHFILMLIASTQIRTFYLFYFRKNDEYQHHHHGRFVQIQSSSWKKLIGCQNQQQRWNIYSLSACVHVCFRWAGSPGGFVNTSAIIIISSLCCSHKKPPASVPRSLNIRKHLTTPHQEQSVRFHLLVRPAGGRSLTEWFKRPISQHLSEE